MPQLPEHGVLCPELGRALYTLAFVRCCIRVHVSSISKLYSYSFIYQCVCVLVDVLVLAEVTGRIGQDMHFI